MKTKLVLTALACLSLTACFRHTFQSGHGGTIQKYDQWQHHFIFGLANASGPIDVSKICDSSDFTIEEQFSFGNGVVRLFTGGIYDPTSVKVFCSPKK